MKIRPNPQRSLSLKRPREDRPGLPALEPPSALFVKPSEGSLGAEALYSTTVSLATESASHLVPWRGKLTCARASSPVPSMASTLPSPNLV